MQKLHQTHIAEINRRKEEPQNTVRNKKQKHKNVSIVFVT